MKSVRIGPWDGDQVLVQVEDDATLSDALTQAGLTMSTSQSITTLSDTQTLNRNATVRDGETYLLTGNQVSGFFLFNIKLRGNKNARF